MFPRLQIVPFPSPCIFTPLIIFLLPLSVNSIPIITFFSSPIYPSPPFSPPSTPLNLSLPPPTPPSLPTPPYSDVGSESEEGSESESQSEASAVTCHSQSTEFHDQVQYCLLLLLFLWLWLLHKHSLLFHPRSLINNNNLSRSFRTMTNHPPPSHSTYLQPQWAQQQCGRGERLFAGVRAAQHGTTLILMLC